MPNYLTIDNGGTNTKVTIIDEIGHQLSIASFPTRGKERKPGFHEIDLNRLWTDLGQICHEALDQANLKGDQIDGISTVGHGKGLYVLNRKNEIFTDGILSADSRATTYAERFEASVSEIFQISHQHVMASQAPVILRWLKKNEKDTYQNIGAVLSNKDFVRYLLTGVIAQEIGDASGNSFLNLKTQKYDKRLFDFFEIPEMYTKMPKLVHATDQCGSITKTAEKMLGIKQGTPVFGGMFDINACAVATGVLDNTKFSLIAGTWNMNLFPSDEMASFESGLMNSVFPTGKTLIEASSPTSAGNLDLMVKMLMTAEIRDANENHRSIYEDLEIFLDNTDANFSKLIFFPFLYGTNSDLNATGAFIGLQSSTTKSEMLRAVYEGIAFAHRDHIQSLLDVLGHKPEVIRMSGGGTNSKSWVQMFADILELPIELVDAKELGGLGGAITSAVGSGFYSDIPEAVLKMSHVKERFEPQVDQVLIYKRKYDIYETLLNALKGSWESLKSFQEGVTI